jgi:hypothetical protein
MKIVVSPEHLARLRVRKKRDRKDVSGVLAAARSVLKVEVTERVRRVMAERGLRPDHVRWQGQCAIFTTVSDYFIRECIWDLDRCVHCDGHRLSAHASDKCLTLPTSWAPDATNPIYSLADLVAELAFDPVEESVKLHEEVGRRLDIRLG